MRRHGPAARAIASEVQDFIFTAMWTARVLREARSGAIVVAGPDGEVLSIRTVAIDGYGVDAVVAPFAVRPEIRQRYGTRWVQSNLGEDASSVDAHVTRESPASAAPSLGQGTNL